jgi:hypothetical protein
VSAESGELLLHTQRRLESLYALPQQAPVTDFLIAEDAASGYPGRGSRTLVTEQEGALSVGVVLAGAVHEQLARRDPRVHLDKSNLNPFCVLTEEVSHFVYLLFCAQAERPVTQLELELQAEIDKYLCAAFLLSLQNEGAVSPGLRALLFRHYRMADGLSAEQVERYQAASTLADRYCGYLEGRYLRAARVSDMVKEARRFYRLTQREKLERIAAC